jgi:cyanate permease
MLSWTLYFSFGLISTSLSILVTPIMNDLGLTYSQMGFVLGSWQLIYIFCAQPLGLVIDRIGPYPSLFLGAVIMALSSALRPFAINFDSLAIYVGLFGIGGPLISIGIPKLVSIWFQGDERGTASGVYTTGPIIGGVIALSLTNSVFVPLLGNWKTVLHVYSLIGLLIAFLWLLVGRKALTINSARGYRSLTGKKTTWKAMKTLFKSKNIWLIVAIGITFFLSSHGLANWLPKLFEAKGTSSSEAGYLAAFHRIFGIFGSIALSKLPHILKSKKLAIAITLFVQGVFIIILGVTAGPIMWLALAFVGITTKGLLPILTIILMDMPEVGPIRMGIAGGLFFALGEIGGFGGPFVMGLLKDITGSFLSGLIFIAAITEASIVLASYLKVDVPVSRVDK